MAKNQIRFKTQLSTLTKGGKPCYIVRIVNNGTDRVIDGLVRFNLGSRFFTLEPAVSGSVPTMDAKLGEEFVAIGNLPAPGEYTVTLDCHRVNGYDETEEIAIPDVKVVIG